MNMQKILTAGPIHLALLFQMVFEMFNVHHGATLLPLDVAELTIGLWALAHPDLVRSARVHAIIEHLAEALSPPAAA